MSDPRLEPVDPKRTKLSPLMWHKARAKNGAKVNACPFGCPDSHLDHNGYCRHLVGFTNDKKFYEPMRRIPSGGTSLRKVQLEFEVDEEQSVPGEEPVMKPVLPAVREGDLLVQISTSWRVYRDVPAMKERASRASA